MGNDAAEVGVVDRRLIVVGGTDPPRATLLANFHHVLKDIGEMAACLLFENCAYRCDMPFIIRPKIYLSRRGYQLNTHNMPMAFINPKRLVFLYRDRTVKNQYRHAYLLILRRCLTKIWWSIVILEN